MNTLRLSAISHHAADAWMNAGLVETQYLVPLMKNLYAQVQTVEQPDDPAEAMQNRLFVHACWHFVKVDQTNMLIGFNEGLRLLNKAFDQSYEAVEVSVTLDGKTFTVWKYAAHLKVRTYRIGDHNQVFSDVCEYQHGEHYVTYHQVMLDENEGLELLCALHFERLGHYLPFGGKFYYEEV
jgi:hypothetical protein